MAIEYKDLLDLLDRTINTYTLHLESLRKLANFLTESKKISTQFLPSTDQSDLDELELEYSFKSLITISILDLSVICKGIVKAGYDWEKLFFIKNAYLVIHETIDKYSHYNKELNPLITKKYPELLEKYNKINHLLKEFKKNTLYKKNIEIRNVVAGHIDKNFIKYYDTLILIKGTEDVNLIISFIQILKASEEFTHMLGKISGRRIEDQLGTSKTRQERKEYIEKALENIRKLIK